MTESSPYAKRERTDWFVVMALFAAGLAAAMQFAKIVPVMQEVRSAFGMSLVTSGLSVSILGLVGICFAVAVGAIVRAIGTKTGVLLAIFAGSLFAALGAVAPNAPLFLASRLLEGFSHLLIVVCAPAIMAAHAAPKDSPIVLSIWACFFGLGFAIVSAMAPVIVPVAGWRGLLLSHALLLAIIGTAAWIALTRSGYQQVRSGHPSLARIARAHIELLKSGAPLLLAICFCAYTLQFLTMLTFLGKYLQDVQGWSTPDSNAFMSAVSLVTLVATLTAGVLVRFGIDFAKGTIAAFAGLALAVAAVFILQLGGAGLVTIIIFMMFCFGLLPGFIVATVPRVAHTHETAAITYAAIALLGNVGTFLGTPVFAAFYEAGGWVAGALFVIATTLSGTLLTAALKRKINQLESRR